MNQAHKYGISGPVMFSNHSDKLIFSWYVFIRMNGVTPFIAQHKTVKGHYLIEWEYLMLDTRNMIYFVYTDQQYQNSAQTWKLFQIYLSILMYLRTGLDFKGPTPISYVVKRNSFPDAKEYDLQLSVTTIFGTTETTSTSICFKEGIIITHCPCWFFLL